VLDHGRAAPHRGVDLDGFGARPIGPAIEAAADLAVIIPGNDLALLGAPAIEQAGFGHRQQQP